VSAQRRFELQVEQAGVDLPQKSSKEKGLNVTQSITPYLKHANDMPSELNELSSRVFIRLEKPESKQVVCGKFFTIIVGRILPFCGKTMHTFCVVMPPAHA